MSVWTLSLIAIVLPSLASADEFKDPLFPQASLCPVLPGQDVTSPDEPVPPGAVITWLLGENLVSDRALDSDGDGNTLLGEKIRALTDETYCASHSGRCTPADEQALAKARLRLSDFVAERGGPGYVFELGDREKAITPRVLLEGHVQIVCVALAETLPGADEKPKGYWHRNADKPGGFRLVGDINNLSKSRSSLGAVKAAQLSITSDLNDGETAYRIDAVAGYAFNIIGGDEFETTFIPFLEVERFTNDGETEIDTLGAGFQQSATIDWPDPLYSEFALTPVYRTDSDFESSTGTLKSRWTPTLAKNVGFPLGYPAVYGPVQLSFGLDLLADIGRVFKEGDQDNLDGEGNFLRLGNNVSMQIRGAPGSFFRPIEIQLSNRYLYNVDTNFGSINQFDAALAYLFPVNDHYQLSLTYSNGRDENSLELFELWQTQFGIRF